MLAARLRVFGDASVALTEYDGVSGIDRSSFETQQFNDMNHQPFQFSIRRILWAILWIGIGLATIPLFDATHFLDDDGDNVPPRMLAA